MRLLSVIIRISIIAMVVVCPWFFGGVWAKTQWALLLLTSVLLAADLVARFGRYDPITRIPTGWFPLLLGIALGISQLIPLSHSMANRIAPKMTELRLDLTMPANDAPDNGIRPRVVHTRTLYSAGTREYLALLVLVSSIFVLASTHAVDRKSIEAFLVSAAICGSAISFFGLIQRLSWNGKFFWFVETNAANTSSFGSFVNRNNAGGFLNLCLAASLGLLIFIHWRKPSIQEQLTVVSRRRVRDKPKKETQSDTVPNSTERTKTADPSSQSTPDSSKPEDPQLDERAARYAEMLEGERVKEEGPSVVHPTKPERQRVRIKEKVKVKVSKPDEQAERFNKSVRGSSYRVFKKKQPVATQISDFFADYFASVSARKLWAIAFAIILVGGVLSTGSRGSIMALMGATLVTAAAYASHTGKRSFAIGLLVALVAGAGLVSWAGQSDFVQHRLSLLFDDETLESGRLPNWQEALKTVPDFWGWGSGLGSYRYVYERYQIRFLNNVLHFHAENQFIQALIEGGMVALGLLISMIVVTGIYLHRLFVNGGVTNTALAVCGTFALTSQLIGGCFDFGLYIPSNALLMATLCGIVVGRSALVSLVGNIDAFEDSNSTENQASGPYDNEATFRDRTYRLDEFEDGLKQPNTLRGGITGRRFGKTKSEKWAFLSSVPVPSVLLPLLIGCLLVSCLFGSLEMHKAGMIEAAMHAAPLSKFREVTQPEAIKAALGPLQRAVRQRWDDANAHRHLSELWQQLYQAQTYQDLIARQAPSEVNLDNQDNRARDDGAWFRAGVLHLHETVRRLQGKGDFSEVDRLLRQPAVKESLGRAMRHAMLAREHCPTIPQVHYALAEKSMLENAEPNEALHLQRAKLLSPGDATLFFYCGILELNSGRVDQATKDWNRSLSLSPMHLSGVIANSKGKLTGNQLLYHAIPNDAGLLLQVVQREEFKNREAVRKIILQRAEEAIRDTNLPEDQLDYVAASIYRLVGNFPQAKSHYEMAIRKSPQKLLWRYQFAEMLYELQEYDEAYDHIDFVIRKQTRGSYTRLKKKIAEGIARTAKSDDDQVE